jgi:hypothetical protein
VAALRHGDSRHALFSDDYFLDLSDFPLSSVIHGPKALDRTHVRRGWVGSSRVGSRRYTGSVACFPCERRVHGVSTSVVICGDQFSFRNATLSATVGDCCAPRPASTGRSAVHAPSSSCNDISVPDRPDHPRTCRRCVSILHVVTGLWV